MTETAQPVVEAAVAPNTPAQSETAVTKKLSYNVAMIPNPINSHEAFVHAALVEQRATRLALEKIAALLEDLVTELQKPKK